VYYYSTVYIDVVTVAIQYIFCVESKQHVVYSRLSKQAKFVLIPGPDDAGDNVTLPRRSLPSQLTQTLTQRVTNITFGSNPCRIKFYTQEIVLFRENLIKKMQRHVAISPNSHETAPEMSEQAVSSMVDQAHLCPLPLHARPVIW
jgi:DNA polymerase epsilon subunit 2